MLGTICQLSGGYGFPDSLQGSIEGELPFIKVSDMSLSRNKRDIVNANNYVSIRIADSMGWKPFPAGAVVFAKVGAALKLNRRRILIRPTLIDNNMMVAIPYSGLDSAFLYHFLCAIDFGDFVQDGALPSVNQEQIGSIKIPDINKDEQHRIAEILDTIDDAIQKTEALISKLKAMKQGLLHDLLTRGLDENGKLRDPKAHPEQFKEWALGRVPINWEVNRLGKFLARIDQGWSPDCDSDPAPQGEWGVLKTTAVVWEGYRDNKNKKLPRAHKPIPFYEVRVDDVLMTRGGPNSRVGVVALVHKTQGRLMLSDKIYRLVHNDDVSPAFLTYALSGNRTQRHLSSFKTGMAESQTNISQEIVRSLFITVPPKQEQYIIVKTLAQYGARIRAEEQYRDKLKLQKKGLMQDLLTGKVRVKVTCR